MKQLFLLLFLCTATLSAQEIAWADGVVEVSSQLDGSARHIVGPPDARFENDRWTGVWSPQTPQAYMPQSIRVRFQEPRRARRIVIEEVDNPGAISRILGFDTEGNLFTLYDNQYPRAALVPSRRFTHDFPLTDYPVAAVQVDLNTTAVRGYNSLDAIGLVSEPADDRFTARSPAPVPNAINTPFHDHRPVISADGNTLYFVRRHHPQNVGMESRDDIWVAQRLLNGDWGRAKHLGTPVNTPQPERVVGTSTDGDELYFLQKESPNTYLLQYSRREGRSYRFPRAVRVEGISDISELVFSADLSRILLQTTDGSYYLSRRHSATEYGETEPVQLPASFVRPLHLAADDRTLYGMDQNQQVVIARPRETLRQWQIVRQTDIRVLPEGGLTIPAAGDEYYVVPAGKALADIQSSWLEIDDRPQAVSLLSADRLQSSEVRVKDLRSSDASVRIETDGKDAFAKVLTHDRDYLVYSERPGGFAASQVYNLSGIPLKKLDYNLSSERSAESAERPSPTSEEQTRLRLVQVDRDLARLRRDRVIQADESFAERVLQPVANDYDASRERLRREYEAQEIRDERSGLSSTEDELARMKARYNRAHRGKETEDYLNFILFERRVVSDLAEDVTPEVVADLYTEMLPRIAEEVTRELPDDEQAYLERAQARLVSQHRRVTSREPQLSTENVSERIERELRARMEPEVRAELRRELLPQVRAELRRELTYFTKTELRDDLSRHLPDAAIPSSAQISTEQALASDLYHELSFEPDFAALRSGTILPLPGVFFSANRTELLPFSDTEIERVVRLLREHPSLRVEIAAHTHSHLEVSLADSLTQERAIALRTALILAGIERDRLTVRGYGSSRPVASNEHPTGRLTNQRLELRVW